MKLSVTLLSLVGWLITTNFVHADPRWPLEPSIDALELKQMSAILVQQNGAIVFEQYYNGSQADDLHDIRSASKSITSLLFGIALKQQQVASLEQPVLPVFKDYQPLHHDFAAKQNMTFFDLLSMTNPLECDDFNNFSAGHEERMYLQADWIEFTLSLPERGYQPWTAAPHERPYQRAFAYCTAGIALVGAALERITQASLSDYAEQHLFAPLDIQNVKWLTSPKGITQGGGGLQIRPRDLVKIGQLMLNQGRWQNREIVTPQWVKQSFTPYSQAMPEMNADYGLTWWIFNIQSDVSTLQAFAAAGNGGNYLFVVPELNLVSVITSKAYNTPYMHQQTHQVFKEIILPKARANIAH
ncbi:MAG: serine hydrolase [Gammaproteobacteria bacterium]|nr:serine hydrolase [Gammaproteobacteria bacterium]